MNTNVANLTKKNSFFDTFFSTNMSRLVTHHAILQKKIAKMQILHQKNCLWTMHSHNLSMDPKTIMPWGHNSSSLKGIERGPNAMLESWQHQCLKATYSIDLITLMIKLKYGCTLKLHVPCVDSTHQLISLSREKVKTLIIVNFTKNPKQICLIDFSII